MKKIVNEKHAHSTETVHCFFNADWTTLNVIALLCCRAVPCMRNHGNSVYNIDTESRSLALPGTR